MQGESHAERIREMGAPPERVSVTGSLKFDAADPGRPPERLTRLFDQTEVRILAVSVVYAVDCAICRLIVDDPDRAHDLLTGARFQVSETELLVVCLPHGKRALLHTWATLLGGEINILYTYPLLVRPKGCSAIAVLPDNMEQAVSLLRERGFTVLDQQDLMDVRLE